ncbi:MAG: S-layer homology domain-containing protein [Oscillospiraceae bacterium]|nr:S-layer homology domain-containing protein [Oscillospiraceae bacterium]
MKKATSFLLTLVMLVGMLPAASLSVAAAESTGTLNAYYTYTAIAVDGKLDDGKWMLTEKIGSTPAALLCDAENLYLGLQTVATGAEVTLNGVTVAIDMAAGSVVADGVSAGSVAVNTAAGTVEAQISLAALGMVYDPGQTYDFVAKMGGDSFNGKLNFAHKALLISDDYTNTASKTYAAELGKTSAEAYVVEENGSLRFKTGDTMTDKGADGRITYVPNKVASEVDFTKGYDMVMNVDFNDLIVVAEDKAAYWGMTGFSVYYATNAIISIGFHADAAGNIYVSQYEKSHALVKKIDTGLDLPAKNANIRLAANDDFEVEVHVNGKKVGAFPTTSGSGAKNALYLWSATSNRDLTATRKNDVLLHDFCLLQAAPAPELKASAVANGLLKVDGAANESFWTLDGSVEDTRFGALVDEENLYLALDSRAGSVDFTFGALTATAKLGKQPKFELGYTMGSTIKGNGKGQYEISVPLNLLHQTAPAGQKLDMSVAAGETTRRFTLTLGGGTVLTQTIYAPVSGDGKNDAVAYLDVAGLKLDGDIRDLQWYTPYKAAGSKGPGAEFGFQWDAKNLYVGGQIFTAIRADKLELTVGGKTLAADLQAGTASVGQVYVSGQSVEWAIPQSEIGLSGMGSKSDYEIKVTNADGTTRLYGALELIGTSVIIGDTATDFTTKDYTIRDYNPKMTSWTQADGYQQLRTDPALGDAIDNYGHVAFPTMMGHAYEFTVDLQPHGLPILNGYLAWRSLCWEIRQADLQGRFGLRDGGDGSIVCDMLYYSVVESVPTGKKLGDRFTFTISMDKNDVPSMYIDGQWVHTFQKLDRTTFTVVDDFPFPQLRVDALNRDALPNDEGKYLGINVDIFSTLWTQNYFVDAQATVNTALDSLTAEGVLAEGTVEDALRLTLPKQVSFAASGITVPVTWKVLDKTTGQSAANVNTNTGVITRSSKAVAFDLIATASYGGVTLSNTITLTTKGSNAAGKVALIVDDANPLTGSAGDFSTDSFEWFDTNHNSLVYDQGGSKAFNTIKLYDLDEYSRLGQRHLGVFVSEDGKEWTKVTGWLLHQDGKEYTLYNLNETARYVKVHTYHDTMDMSGLGDPTFYNAIQSMMTVSNEQSLPLAGGAFAHKAEVKVTDSGKDVPVFVSIASLGAKAGQYKADASDFRFTADGKTLAHWYNGVDGFYVRVPSAPATVTAHWGCASAKDFSDPEAVFEVAYGNVALINISKETAENFGTADAMTSHGRPFVFPNGDVIAVGRRKTLDADIAVYRSTDGGHTFTTKPVLAYDDTTEIKSGIMRASGFGGFIWDESVGDKGRLYIVGYTGSVYDSNDYRLLLTYSDDYGYTWSEPRHITDPALEKVKDNDYVMTKGYGDGLQRAITVCDGLKLKEADGDGPNVDYVIIHYLSDLKNDRSVVSATYSADGGKSWAASDKPLYMDLPGTGIADYNGTLTMLPEQGFSETGFAQLDDGSLYLIMRAQQYGNIYFYEGRSTDGGKTWTADYSKVPASNTSPTLYKYGNDRLIAYGTRTGEGTTTYLRSPLYMGLSSDNYETYDNVLDVTFGTSFDSINDKDSRVTQIGVGVSPDGKELFGCWYDQIYNDVDYMGKTTVGIAIEDFDQMIYGNKGGYEDFEDSSLKYMGWLVNKNGKVELTRDVVATGLQAMKVEDVTGVATANAVRQVPSMKAGTVGAKIMVPEGNKDAFTFELRSAYGFDYLVLALTTLAIAPDGTLSLCYEDGKVAVGKVEVGVWNDIAISFDIAANQGKLYVNGKAISDIKLKLDQTIYPLDKNNQQLPVKHEDVIQEICAVQFGQVEATKATGDCLYVDDFYAIELTTPLNRSGAAVVEPPKDEPKNELTFADVKSGDWFYEAVAYATANGIMSGYSSDKFGPNDTLNRAMVVQVLYNKEGQPDLNGQTHSFSDVPASQWCNNAVTWGSNRGVVSGYGGGVFKPEDAVTIEQVAVILRNYSGSPNGSGNLSKVGQHSDWAADALKWAVEKGILANVPFTNATEQATRAQTAQMLTNYLRGN